MGFLPHEVLCNGLLEYIFFPLRTLRTSGENGSLYLPLFSHSSSYLLLNCIVDEDVDAVGLPSLLGLEELAEPTTTAWKRNYARQFRRKRNAVRASAHADAQIAAKNGTDEDSSSLDRDFEQEEKDDEQELAKYFADAETAAEVVQDPKHLGLLPPIFSATSPENQKKSSSPPTAGACGYVIRHIDRLLPQCLQNLVQWTSELRIGAAKLLRVLLVFLHRHAEPYCEEILVHLYKAVEDEDKPVAESVLECAKQLGIYCEERLLVKQISAHLAISVGSGGGGSGDPAGGSTSCSSSSNLFLPDKVKGVAADPNMDQYWGETKVNRTKVRCTGEKAAQPFVALSVENKRQVLKILSKLAEVFAFGTLGREHADKNVSKCFPKGFQTCQDYDHGRSMSLHTQCLDE